MASKEVVTWDDIARTLNDTSASMKIITKACEGLTAVFQELINYVKDVKGAS